MFNRTFGYILVAALAAGLGLLAAFHFLGRDDAPAAPPLQAVTLLPQPRELPAFNLRQSDGTPLVPGELKGHWTLVFLGFTTCPDVCPTTLAEMVQVKEMLGADGDKLQVLFVTVDPERDTAQILKEYLGNFDPSFVALVPTPEELRTKVAPDFKVYYKKVEGSTPTSYTMDHTAGVLLFDPKGKIRVHCSYGTPADSIAADVKTLLAEA